MDMREIADYLADADECEHCQRAWALILKRKCVYLKLKMTNFFARWLLFFYIFSNIAVVSAVYLVGYNEPVCWEEKRLGNNGKYQPATVLVKVCEFRR